MADDMAGVRLTHPGKLLYAAEGITKRDVAAYYLRVAERMLPHIRGRLLSLVRCPRGSGDGCFFQRHASRGFPKAFHRLTLREEDGGEGEYIYIDGQEGLVAAAQIGALELHIWGSLAADVEHPNRVVFDLDPDAGLDLAALKKAAADVQDILRTMRLVCYILSTGGKGLHVVCPIEPRHEWPEVKAFARRVAESLATVSPDRYTTNIRKAARKGRIFIDYLRNDRSATSICPYSTRNRPGATIAAPLGWDGLQALESPHPITLRDAAALDRLLGEDPWAGYFDVRQTLPVEAPGGSKPPKRAGSGDRSQG